MLDGDHALVIFLSVYVAVALHLSKLSINGWGMNGKSKFTYSFWDGNGFGH